jgi:hypothetical protein
VTTERNDFDAGPAPRGTGTRLAWVLIAVLAVVVVAMAIGGVR